MQKPWDLKTNDTRTSDSIVSFFIFCEDQHSEPIYFQWFATQKIKITTFGNQKSNFLSITNAINQCVNDGIIEKRADGYAIIVEGIEIWCVFDRDKSEVTKNDIAFNLAVETAKNNNIQVAWSNDSFELWILLHFIDINQTVNEAKDRAYYYQELTKYFSSLTPPNEHLKRIIENPHKTLDYKYHLKSEKNFTKVVLPEIIPHTHLAIERAKRLFDSFITEPEHCKKEPCTSVFLLVEQLLNKGGKNISAI